MSTTLDTRPSGSFTDLGVAADLTETLAGLGITTPTPIQTLTIPDALAGRDVCGRAETGSGKTFAFGLPLVELTKTADPGHPRSLVLVPTRELCTQVAGELASLAAGRGLRVGTIYGGVSMQEQTAALRSGIDLLVATPGRLLDLADRGAVRLDEVGIVVIDEADQMADMGFLPQVHLVMRAVGGDHQTMLFSATLDGAVAALVRSYMTDPVRHETATPGELVETQEHRFLAVHALDKPKVAAVIARSARRTLLFVATRHGADRVARRLRDEGVEAQPIHGDLRQAQREWALQRFATGDLPVLVATNVAARGLHIDDVDIVLHYDPPADYKNFIHRSGRTARAGESGLVVTLVEWDQVDEARHIQRGSGLNQEIVKMYSNDPRLTDLGGFSPDRVELRRTTNAEVSRRMGRRRRR